MSRRQACCPGKHSYCGSWRIPLHACCGFTLSYTYFGRISTINLRNGSVDSKQKTIRLKTPIRRKTAQLVQRTKTPRIGDFPMDHLPWIDPTVLDHWVKKAQNEIKDFSDAYLQKISFLPRERADFLLDICRLVTWWWTTLISRLQIRKLQLNQNRVNSCLATCQFQRIRTKHLKWQST